MSIKFGTDGWRAIISDEFTISNVRIVAQAIAKYVNDHKLGSKGIIVGYDTRFMAEHFAEEVIKVLHANGIPCFMTDRDCPTPVVAFSIKDKNSGGAVMITASHNPPQYCGIKFLPEYAGPASQNITDEIVKNLGDMSKLNAQSNLKIERINPYQRYLKHIEELIDFDEIKRAKLRVAYDPLWGTGREYLDRILEQFGAEVKLIHGNRDVLFGGITPEPIGEHLNDLRDTVIKEKCSAGLSTDPDADRFGILDEKGNFVSANAAIPVIFSYLVTERGETGSVARSVATTHLIDRIAENHGIKVHETPVGFKYIAEIMLKEPVILGGEESGGLTIGGHIPEKDGILANLLVCEMMAKYKKPLSAIMDDVSKKYGYIYGKRVNLKLTNEAKNKLMDTLTKDPPSKMGGLKLASTLKIDGVKMIFDDGSWVLARASGTEPIIRTYYESNSEEKLKVLIQNFESFVTSGIGV